MMNNINRLQLHSRNFIQSKKYKITDDYLMGQQLGSGKFGTVFLAICKINKKIRAVKKIQRKKIKNKAQFLNQIQILTKLDHPNIIKIYETYQDQQNYYIVTDFCQGGQLFNRIIQKGSFSEHDAKQMFRQMVYAIKYCHGQKIAHRDLKPQNFVFLDKQSYSLKLIDFGLSYEWKQDMRCELKSLGVYRLVGSPHYIAPEIIKGYYCEKCDIWSLGIILYSLLSALQPFDGQNDKKVLRSVKRSIYTLDIPQMKKVSEQAKDLIRCIIQPESHRYSIQQILAHPWMTNQVSNKDLNINFVRLKKFSQLCHLKKFAKNYIVSQLTGKQVNYLGQIFKQIDTDLDGYISTSQLKTALDRQKQKLSQLQLTQILQILDKQKNGKINYHQFITFFSQTQSLLQQQNLRFVFKNFDTDQDGKISLNEFKNGFQNANYYINQQSFQDIIRRYDKNNDGKIDYDQFVMTLKKI